MKILILMAGSSSDFMNQGFIYPKYLLEIENSLLIEKVVEFILPAEANLIFIVNKPDCDQFFLDSTISLLAPKSTVIKVPPGTKGAVCSVLFGVEQINSEEELIIINGDQLLHTDITKVLEDFRSRKADGGIVTFNSVHPRWSYVLQNKDGYVIQTAEKHPISRNATAGFYYFKKGTDFVDACFEVLKKDVNYNENYYISSTYNELILKQKKIVTYSIDSKDYISFSTYQFYENYVTNHRKDVCHEY